MMDEKLSTFVNQYSISYNTDKTECVIIFYQNTLTVDLVTNATTLVPIEVGRYVMSGKLSEQLTITINDLLNQNNI